MSITKDCIENLKDLRQVVSSLPDEVYAQPLEIFSGSTIGQHVRHVLEFYQCLFSGINAGTVNYDQRKRDERIQTNVAYACNILDEICKEIDSVSSNEFCILTGNTGHKEDNMEKEFSLDTNLYRELYYNLEHCIHHQALIKIGLHVLDQGMLASPSFGFAPSTIRSR